VLEGEDDGTEEYPVRSASHTTRISGQYSSELVHADVDSLYRADIQAANIECETFAAAAGL